MRVDGKSRSNLPRRFKPVVGTALVVGAVLLTCTTAALADSTLQRIWTDLLARPSGPMAFRFILQPIMATIFAIRDGLADARTGRSPYFWTVTHDPELWRSRLKEGLKATSRIIFLGLVMDAIYQYRVFHTFYPVEAIVIAIVLAFVPYLLLRGPVARIARQPGRPTGSA